MPDSLDDENWRTARHPANPSSADVNCDGDQVSEPAEAARSGGDKVGIATVLGRARRLRCPVCGEGPMFSGWLTMNKRCSHCGLWFERDTGYFLGSIYVNYAFTTVIAASIYLVPMLWIGRPSVWLLVPVVGFCIVFPLYFFRYARCLWLSLDHYMSPLDVSERPRHEL
jgi:uncharacterized protein (DUF983 family)